MGSERCKDEKLEHVFDDSSDEPCEECDRLKSRLEKYRLTCRTCHICKEICSSRPELKRHFLTHESETDPCPVCCEQFPNQCELLQHLGIMHIEYLKSKYPALLKKFPHLVSSSRISLSDIPDIHNFNGCRTAFNNAVSIPVSLKNRNLPTEIKNNETRQVSIEVHGSSLEVISNEQSENVQKHVLVASIGKHAMTSNPQQQVSANFKKYKMRNVSSSTRYKSKVPIKDSLSSVNNGKSSDALHGRVLKKTITQSTSSNFVKKLNKNKQINSNQQQLPSIQLQKIPVVSSPTARLPKLIIGETLTGFERLNITKSTEALAPVNSDLNALQHSSCNHKIVKVSPECMKVLKESLLKDSPAVNSKHVCVAVPSKMLNDLQLMPMKSEFQKNFKSVTKTTTIDESKGSDAINQSNVEEILQEDRRRKEEKEKIKKKEKILQKMLMKYEEKEEKKLIKYFQKKVTSYIKKRQGDLNEKEKNLVDIAGNKPKLLEVVRCLKCRDQSDIGRLMKYFGMKYKLKVKSAKDSSIVKFEQKPGMSSMPKSVNPDVSINISNCLKVDESDESFNSFYKKQVCSTSIKKENLAYESESLYLLDNLNSHKTIPYGEDPFTDMSIITDETFTFPCPCGKVNCIR